MQIQFDASQVAPAAPQEVIPTDWYDAMIVETGEQVTSDQTGKMMTVTLEVLDGPHKGHRLFDRLNLVNKNQTAVEIAYRTLSAICHAVGVIQVQDTQQLHQRPLAVKVGTDPARSNPTTGEQYEARNKVTGYKPGPAAQYRTKPAAPAFAQPGAQAAPFAPPAVAQTWVPPQQQQPAAQPQWQPPVQQQPAPQQQWQPPVQQAPVQQQPQWQPPAPQQGAPAQPTTTVQSPAPTAAQAPAMGGNPPWQQQPQAQQPQGQPANAPKPPWAQ